jgi:division protein CdvB (Snf7/Vps24/ESCRT-III family)
LSYRNALKVIGVQREEGIKGKIGSAIREIELHRRELESLRGKLAQRRKLFYDTTVRALIVKDKSKANVYANEWAELRKVTKVVYASELALTQVILRLESIHEVGEVIAHMSTAFKVLRRVSKTMQGFVPALDRASEEINTTLAETMTEIGNMTPSISLDIQSESGEELVEQARKYAEEQAEKMQRSLLVTPEVIERHAESVSLRVPILATGEEGERDEIPFLGVLYGSTREEGTEDQVLKYASAHAGAVDVNDASAALCLQPDEVEHAMLKLLSDGKVKLVRSGEGSL